MPLKNLSDAALAARAAAGDDVAFTELARRYARLISHTIRQSAFGLTHEEQRQEAMIGLFKACRAHDPAKGDFGAIATTCIRRSVWTAKTKACANKHRVLSEALALDYRDNPDALSITDRLRAGPGSNPALVVELREELRERAANYRPPRPRGITGKRIRQKRYTPEQIATAVRLVHEGKSHRAAARALGATHYTVTRWLQQAA